MESLGTLPGRDQSFPVGIDSNGTIAGNSGEPWIWTPFNGMQPIPSLPAGSHITSLRNGVAAGYVCDAACQSGGGGGYSFIWRNHHGPRFFGQTDSQHSNTANALNSVQQVVGTTCGPLGCTAFLWTTSGTLYDLNKLVHAPGWVLQTATGINDSAQIVGVGTLNGVTRGYLLTMIPKEK
jgi:hypothetical protein